ncbi:hypothetical protein Ciccas_004212 [Cichlidogyrus casuarinus]|uniref:Uncharacterized protein n=1 Tax=Cichlidogyrus casuarinus TaxID=1844966 RepID=A0ABD2QEH7_9PLAT
MDQKQISLHPIINNIVDRLLHLPADEIIKNSSIICKSYEKARVFHFPLVYLSATDRQVLNSFHNDNLVIASLSLKCLQSLIKAFKSKILSEYLYSVVSPIYG